MTRQADFKRRVRARMTKTGESYAAARAQTVAARRSLARSEGDRSPLLQALHVTNGDSAAAGLRATGQTEQILPWRDALHEGAVPDVPAPELRRIRAAVLAGDDPARGQEILDWLEQRDETLAEHRDGEYVLWFEADLYDQLQLVQILAQLHELHVPPERITLICIGEHLGMAHFGGLGELQPAQLQDLPARAAIPLSAAAVDFAARVWAALRAPNPAGLSAIAAAASSELRFVPEAFDRLSREYPSTRDGLSLTERRILAATAGQGSGTTTAGAVFRRIGARESRPYLGDHLCWRIMERLTRARVPLLEAEPPDRPIGAATRLRLTANGHAVLRGEADHVTQSGIDRWIGGVHLSSHQAAWRWDEGTESLVAGAHREATP